MDASSSGDKEDDDDLLDDWQSEWVPPPQPNTAAVMDVDDDDDDDNLDDWFSQHAAQHQRDIVYPTGTDVIVTASQIPARRHGAFTLAQLAQMRQQCHARVQQQYTQALRDRRVIGDQAQQGRRVMAEEDFMYCFFFDFEQVEGAVMRSLDLVYRTYGSFITPDMRQQFGQLLASDCALNMKRLLFMWIMLKEKAVQQEVAKNCPHYRFEPMFKVLAEQVHHLRHSPYNIHNITHMVDSLLRHCMASYMQGQPVTYH